MEKFMTWMETHMMPVAAKLGNNKYLKAISSGFIAVMAATIVGSMFTYWKPSNHRLDKLAC